jgi:hypothetical protein
LVDDMLFQIRYTMKHIKTNIFILLIALVSLSSCSIIMPVTMQRPYVATSPNVNCFEKSNEKNCKISLFVNHYDLQSNFVLSKKFGLSFGIDGAFNGQYGGEIAGIFYKRFNATNYFEVQCGYGYFTNQSTMVNQAWDAGALIEYGEHYSRTVNTNYHKIFIQPTYFCYSRKVNYGFAVKISANYFNNYDYHYNLRDDSKGDEDYTDLSSTANFNYKWNFVCEPVLKIDFERILFIQLSGILSSNIQSSTIYHYHNGNPASKEADGKLNNPDHLDFVLTIGYEIKFGRKLAKELKNLLKAKDNNSLKGYLKI